MNNILELFRTNIGSHMWGMEHPKSDIDMAVVYAMDSRDWIIGKKPRGKQVQDGMEDTTFYELDVFITHLLKGNCNYLWAIMSPIMFSKYKSAFVELRQIVATNIAKNCYYSIDGMSRHNIYHFIECGDRYSLKYKKKLNLIGRTLKFGINALLWGKYMFQKTDIKSEEELYDLKIALNNAFLNSTLPEKPDPKPFHDYLVKWRLIKMKLDGLID